MFRERILGRIAPVAVAVLLWGLAASPAKAVPPVYLPDDVAGSRSIAMGDAFRAVGTSNDAVIENPSAMALTPHYEIAGFFAWDTAAPAAYWNGSVVDAQTLPLAVGLSYAHVGSGSNDPSAQWAGRYVGSTYRLALALPVSDIISIGGGAHWLQYGGDVHSGTPVNSVTADAALTLHFAEILTISAVGYNLVNVGTVLAPLRAALAASVGSDTTFRVAADLVGTFDPLKAIDVHLGAEYFLGGLVALRGGYFYSGIVGKHYASGGLGLVVPGFAIDGAFRESLSPFDDRLFVIDLKFFLNG